jgi:hypothetical protein
MLVIVRLDRTIHGSILLGGFAGANKLTMTLVLLRLSKAGFPDHVGE